MKKLLTVISLFLLMIMTVCAALSVQLSWERSCDISVTGYKLYQATNATPRSSPLISGGFTNSCGNWEPLRTNIYNGDYKIIIDVGNVLTYNITSNLRTGSTNMFMVTAYDAAGMESDPSNELEFRIPRDSSPTAPYISPISDKMIVAGTGIIVPFSVYDAESPSEELLVVVTTTNPSLISTSNITLNMTNLANASMIIKPIGTEVGVCDIKIMATDFFHRTTNSFQVTVYEVTNTVPTVPTAPKEFMIINAQ
jgi:hypothetical protein